MRTATLTRRLPKPGDNSGTLSKYIADSGLTLSCVERPWTDKDGDGKDDANESCIQPGPKSRTAYTYLCKWLWSPKHKRNCYHLQDVEGRIGIEIETANVYQQLKGCIAPGLGFDTFPDGFPLRKEGSEVLERSQIGVTKSVGALAMLEKDMQDEQGNQVDFELTVQWGTE